jgi:hypothetical protein
MKINMLQLWHFTHRRVPKNHDDSPENAEDPWWLTGECRRTMMTHRRTPKNHDDSPESAEEPWWLTGERRRTMIKSFVPLSICLTQISTKILWHRRWASVLRDRLLAASDTKGLWHSDAQPNYRIKFLSYFADNKIPALKGRNRLIKNSTKKTHPWKTHSYTGRRKITWIL